MDQKERSRVADAAAKATRDLSSTAFADTREYQIDMAVNGVGWAIDNLRWGWVDPKNHQYIAAQCDNLVKQRDSLSRLIENVEAYGFARQAAE